MRNAEGVIDREIRQIRQLFGKSRIIFRFFRMKAHIFEQQHFARGQSRRFLLSFFAHAVRGELHRGSQKLGQMRHYRLQ